MELNDYSTMMFWSKVDQGEQDACWLWKGTINKERFPIFAIKHGAKRDAIPAHRFLYMLAHNVSSDQVPWYDVVYSCGDRRCLNPNHIQFVNERPTRAKASLAGNQKDD